jgi:DNA-binding Lrp family transcriptional regulator
MSSQFSADNYFAVVPEWLIYSGVSAQAVRVYCVLARHADKDTTKSFPSHNRIAKLIGVSNSTVRNALKELIDLGAVVVEHRYDKESGHQKSNNYYLINSPLQYLQYFNMGVATDKHHPYQDTNDITKVNKTKVNNDEHKQLRKNLKRVLNDIIGVPTNDNEHAKRGQAIKLLIQSNATVEEVIVRAEMYKKKWKDVQLTDTAIANNWLNLGRLVDENKQPTPYNCKDSGHVMFNLSDDFAQCQYCKITTDDL